MKWSREHNIDWKEYFLAEKWPLPVSTKAGQGRFACTKTSQQSTAHVTIIDAATHRLKSTEPSATVEGPVRRFLARNRKEKHRNKRNIKRRSADPDGKEEFIMGCVVVNEMEDGQTHRHTYAISNTYKNV